MADSPISTATIDDNKPTLVALMDPSISSSNDSLQSIDLIDPHTEELRPYLVSHSETTLYEIQCLEDDYTAFLTSGIVVGRNNYLHVITPVDPLFWVLPQCTIKSSQWQPLSLPPIKDIKLETLFSSMNLGEDELVYKFSSEKALGWLRRKQERVQTVMEVKQSNLATKRASAVPSNFQLAEEDMPKTVSPVSSQETSVPTKNTRARDESIQLICSYLNAAWIEAFLTHLNESPDALMDATAAENKRRRVSHEMPVVQAAQDWNLMMSTGISTATTEAESKKPPIKVSAAIKRLAKVNTKGMKTMNSFFKKK
jgi:ribonuclease H2 subunit B